MEFLSALEALSKQPLAWMCFFLSMAVFSFMCLIVMSMSAIRQRRAAGDQFRSFIIDRQIELQRAQEEQAHALRWNRMKARYADPAKQWVEVGSTVTLDNGEKVFVPLPMKFPAPTQWSR